MADEKVVLPLSKEEALVLFEFLSRFSDDGSLEIKDKAEEKVLWDLQCLLEKQLVEPFYANYDEILEQSRARLRDIES